MVGGLHLFERNGVRQCRLPVRKQGKRRYIWRSLKTTNIHEARLKAENWQLDVKFAEKFNRLLFPKTVNPLIEEWLGAADLTDAKQVAWTPRITGGDGGSEGRLPWRRAECGPPSGRSSRLVVCFAHRSARTASPPPWPAPEARGTVRPSWHPDPGRETPGQGNA